MSGRACSICVHPEVGAIQRLVGEGVPLVDVCSRFERIKKSALHRHMTLHTGRPTGKKGARDSGIRTSKGPATKSLPDGRCPTCEQLTGENDGSLAPENIVKRAERILHISESIALKAEAGDDSRLALLAVDRCQRSIDTLARIAGLLKPDSLTVIDNRTVNQFASWPTEAVRAITEFAASIEAGMTVQEALASLQGAKESAPRALPAGRSDDEAA